MTIHTRQVCAEDGPALLAARAATRENPFSLEALAAAGINPESLAHDLKAGTLAGWLSETAPTGEVVGFCLANLPEAELWVLAVVPAYERRGIGRDLLARTEALLWAVGHASAWLWTSSDRSLSAYHLYRATGWQEDAEPGDGRLYLRKARPTAMPQRTDLGGGAHPGPELAPPPAAVTES
jgi:GNAT superfamily N-acetyltransferase